ncbi:cyclin-dependent kinase inhibitor far1 [Entomophthora muscae]|uniref:Cyclin-dependent kinase inhibitor far1 n=1 Tax=Entomophthora muscae TaxID=34485 RepID=A0ACC2UHD2_9FUNG|nr:cyclin-dependent kinase inhibitor far1 [Entomophthora muscae]
MNNINLNGSGAKILLTGATNLVGVMVLEKLLRDQYNDIDSIYVLIRPSEGVERRLEQIFSTSLFDCLRSSHPSFVDKVIGIAGDPTQPKLGIDCDVAAKLSCSIETIIHCANSNEFCLPIKEAFEANTMDVVRLLELADKCTKLHGIVYVSSAYVNANIKNSVIEEQVYPFPIGDPKYLVENIPIVPQSGLESLEAHVLTEYPNTYTFAKALGEHVLISKSNRWNIAIVRPSIVSSSIMSPTPGWMHGLSAISSITALVGLGIVDCIPVQAQAVVDLVPVDYVASMIVAALHVVKHQPGYKVYHATSSCLNPLTWDMFRAGVVDGWKRQPRLEKSFGPVRLNLEPDVNAFKDTVKTSRQRLFTEEACKIIKRDPTGSKRIIKLAAMMDGIYSTYLDFCTNQWLFKSHNVVELEAKQMLPSNHVTRNIFATMNWNEYLANFTAGIRSYALDKNPPPKDLVAVPQSSQHIST